jgi:alkaline phosphatase
VHRFLIVLLALACTSATPSLPARSAKPKNVILIIGDGMGPAHFTATRHLRGREFRTGELPVTGWVATSSANSIVTDSAAAATAYATGVKTNNRVVGLDAAGKKVTTALEIAETTGRATGLVTTADFFDATPAAFAAHEASRYSYESLARQMLQSGAEIVAGGGAQRFGTNAFPTTTLESLAAEYGYTLVRSGAALTSAQDDRVLVCFPTERYEVDSPEASLPVLARWAIERLSRDGDGFFLMIESEGTDGTSHNNATDDLIRSVRSVDEVVGIALDFAAKHPDTLILVTGDHDTGGLQIQREKPDAPLELVWSTGGHTGEAVPIFAKGPGAERFTGLLENSDVGKRIQELLAR